MAAKSAKEWPAYAGTPAQRVLRSIEPRPARFSFSTKCSDRLAPSSQGLSSCIESASQMVLA
jgi:hypothetical protein